MSTVTVTGRRGLITTDTLTNAAGALLASAITVTNTEVANGDLVSVWCNTHTGTGAPIPFVVSVGAGTFDLQIVNADGATALTSTANIGYNVIKALV